MKLPLIENGILTLSPTFQPFIKLKQLGNPGCLKLANTGTTSLDEIDALPVSDLHVIELVGLTKLNFVGMSHCHAPTHQDRTLEWKTAFG